MIGNKKIIAVCVARIQDDASNEYVAALNDIAAPAGYGVLVYNTSSVLSAENACTDARFYIYSLMDYSVIDVVIIFEETMQSKTAVQAIIDRAKQHNVPVLIYGEAYEGCINIRFDQETGFAEMVRHMIEEHHLTKLHFMAGMKGNSFSENRLNIFKQILEEHGLPFNESMVSYGDFWSEPAERATVQIVASGNLPEAIICANDKMAIAVCGILNKYGIKIPEEVAVTGFDGIREINFSSPRITSASCEAADIAAKTLDVLEHLEEYRNKNESIFVPARVSVAESCGCRKKEPVDASRYLNSLNDRFYLFQDEALKLSEITSKIQRCDSVDQVVQLLRDSIFYDMSCIVRKDYMDEIINPAEYMDNEMESSEQEMIMFFDCNYYEGFKPYPIPVKDIIPSLGYCLDTNRIIVLTTLHHMGVPMGYVAFYFQRLDNTQGSRITQVANALNTAFGGYWNMRHKNHLIHQIEEMYRIDGLTGLYNRRGFALAYQKLLESEWDNTQLTIILADLDRLKYINDTFGHKEGDFAIRAVADALGHVCPEGSLFTRFGGDEMLAVCQGRIEPEYIKTAFATYFKEFNEQSKKEYDVEASIGIYITKENDVLSFDELIERSDRLMYEEKERHRKKYLKQ